VQLTGRANYARRSQRILQTPPRLSQYITDGQLDFFNAREIINADKDIVDRGASESREQRIATIARDLLNALKG
jgi:hypothetical protein